MYTVYLLRRKRLLFLLILMSLSSDYMLFNYRRSRITSAKSAVG